MEQVLLVDCRVTKIYWHGGTGEYFLPHLVDTSQELRYKVPCARNIRLPTITLPPAAAATTPELINLGGGGGATAFPRAPAEAHFA